VFDKQLNVAQSSLYSQLSTNLPCPSSLISNLHDPTFTPLSVPFEQLTHNSFPLFKAYVTEQTLSYHEPSSNTYIFIYKHSKLIVYVKRVGFRKENEGALKSNQKPLTIK
jgi:hypothetical protein